MKTTQTPGWKSMTAAELLQLAAALRASAETCPAFMRRGLLQRAALRERRAGAILATY